MANNSPRRETLKGLGVSALKIINPNRTKFSYAAIVENNFRAERNKKIRLETKLNRLQAELHEMLYPTAPNTNSTAKGIADRMPVHQNKEFQNKLKVARYLRTGSKIAMAKLKWIPFDKTNRKFRGTNFATGPLIEKILFFF